MKIQVVKLAQSHVYGVHETTGYYARGILALDKGALLSALLGKVEAPALRGWDVAEYGREEDAPRNLREALHALITQNENWGERAVRIDHYVKLEDQRFRRSA